MRVRNIDTEDDAMLLLRSINTRLAIIDDYISTEPMSEEERERWFDTLTKFQKLRDELSKKTVYRVKDFNIVVNYPDIKER